MSADRVEVRSDHDYIGRPLAFYWHEQRHEVSEILVNNRTPGGYQITVRNDQAGIFELFYDNRTGEWSVRQL